MENIEVKQDIGLMDALDILLDKFEKYLLKHCLNGKHGNS